MICYTRAEEKKTRQTKDKKKTGEQERKTDVSDSIVYIGSSYLLH
jgi:hypothetical protein